MANDLRSAINVSAIIQAIKSAGTSTPLFQRWYKRKPDLQNRRTVALVASPAFAGSWQKGHINMQEARTILRFVSLIPVASSSGQTKTTSDRSFTRRGPLSLRRKCGFYAVIDFAW
jgi:hypothetical protein